MNQPYRTPGTRDDHERPAGSRVVMAAMLAAAALMALACTTQQAQSAERAAFDVVQVGCIIANLEVDDAGLKAACGLADALIPAARQVQGAHKVAAHRMMMARVAAAHCPGLVADAGP